MFGITFCNSFVTNFASFTADIIKHDFVSFSETFPSEISRCKFPFPQHFSPIFFMCQYRGADKSLAWPTSWCILFHGWNISFDASLVIYTGCPGRNVPDFGRMFLKLKYTDITQNTYVQSWTVTEIKVREKFGLLAVPRTVPGSHDVLPIRCASPSLSTAGSSTLLAATAHVKRLET